MPVNWVSPIRRTQHQLYWTPYVRFQNVYSYVCSMYTTRYIKKITQQKIREKSQRWLRASVFTRKLSRKVRVILIEGVTGQGFTHGTNAFLGVIPWLRRTLECRNIHSKFYGSNYPNWNRSLFNENKFPPFF